MKRKELAPMTETVRAVDALLGLLDAIDEDPDAIIFFADEGGSWQVGVDRKEILPINVQALAASAAINPSLMHHRSQRPSH